MEVPQLPFGERLRGLGLRPLGWLMGGVSELRHWFYDQGLMHRAEFDLPLICVGNLSAGGTGKTPHVEYLVRLILMLGYQPAVLSRGYGRQTKGFQLASADGRPQAIGDEPAQIWLKYGPDIPVAVGEERALAIPQMLSEYPDIQAIVMDDGFQHLAVAPSHKWLLTSYSRPFFLDQPLPAGMLRERRKFAAQADLIIVTKCPDELPEQAKQRYRAAIRRYSPSAKVFFSGIAYQPPISFGSSAWGSPTHAILVTGVANADPLRNHLSQSLSLAAHLRFPDHHAYRTSDLQRIGNALAKAPPHTVIITTEKDAVKLKELGLATQFWEQHPGFYLPIAPKWLGEEAQLQTVVSEYLASWYG